MTKIDADTDPQHHHQRVELPRVKKVIRYQNGIVASDPIVPGTLGNPLPNPTASRCHGFHHLQATLRHLYGVGKWSYPFQSNVTGSPSRIKKPFDIGGHLPDTGKRYAQVSESHIQRATVQFRHSETQLVIFTARERPAQRLFRFNMAESASENGSNARSIRAPQSLAFTICPRSEIRPSERSIAEFARSRCLSL